MKSSSPAFPTPGEQGSDGMTLRDWFAAHYDHTFMTLNDKTTIETIAGRLFPTDPMAQIKFSFDCVAKLSYMYADAMLRAKEAPAEIPSNTPH